MTAVIEKCVSDTQTKSQLHLCLESIRMWNKMEAEASANHRGFTDEDKTKAPEFEALLSKVMGKEWSNDLDFTNYVERDDRLGVVLILRRIKSIIVSKMPWNDRVAEAVKTGEFMPSDRLDADRWMGCVVGDKLKLEGVTTIRGLFRKISREAFEKGEKFNHLVQNDKVAEAVKTYHEIMGMETVLKCQK